MPQGNVKNKKAETGGTQKTKKNIVKPTRKGAPKKQKIKNAKDKAQQQLGKQINRNIENMIVAKALKNGAKLGMIRPEEKANASGQQRIKKFKNRIEEEKKEQKKNKSTSLPSVSLSSSSSSSTSSSSSSSTPRRPKSK